MKKKDKISLLIFKKAENLITEKELKKLNKYLKDNPDFKEEYVLTQNIFEELKKDSVTKLPDNFNIKLREKLVDYNLNNSRAFKRKYFPIHTVASAVVAVFLVAFAVSYNSIAPLINEKSTSEHTLSSSLELRSVTQDNSKELNNNQTIERKIVEDRKISTSDEVSNTPVVINDVVNTEATSENMENSGRFITDYALSDDETLTVNEYIDSGKFIVISTNLKTDELKDISYEKLSENIFLISMNDYEKVKELIKDFNTEIKFLNEENLLKEEFVLIIKN